MASLSSFIGNCIPPWRAIVLGAPLCLAWSAFSLALAAHFKARCHVATGYSRKLFHLLTFASAIGLQIAAGQSSVCLFGGMATLVLLYAIMHGAGHPWYEALARDGDAPYRTHYIVVSYLATLLGGLLSNLMTGHYALLGYLVCGLGDAAGEPVGTRWGRHWYRVPTRGGITVRRSIEGSLGVFVASSLALLLGIAMLPGGVDISQSLLLVFVIAALSTVLEAVSPHGWDNVTLQLVPSVVGFWILTR